MDISGIKYKSAYEEAFAMCVGYGVSIMSIYDTTPAFLLYHHIIIYFEWYLNFKTYAFPFDLESCLTYNFKCSHIFA